MHSDASAPAASHDTGMSHSTHTAVDHSHHHHHHGDHHHHHDHHGHHGHHHHHNSSDNPDETTTLIATGNRSGQAMHSAPHTAIGVSSILQAILGFGSITAFVLFGIYMINKQHDTSGMPWPPHTYLYRPHRPATTIDGRVHDILSSTPLIDGHNDLAIFIRQYYKNDIASLDFRPKFENGSLEENVDLPRLRSGQVGGAFWSAFVPCPENASYDFSDAQYAQATAATVEQLDLLQRLQLQYPQAFTPSISSSMDISGRENMLRKWQETRSLFGPLSLEGLHQVPPTSPLSTLRLFHTLGVRMATLTWNCHNPFADASLLWSWSSPNVTVVNEVFRPKEGAVTFRGRQILKEMNRLGIIIDISHTSYWTQKAVLSPDQNGHRLTRAPVVFSHSSAYSICPHPRNVRDDILDLVPKTNSLVMVNFSPGFISCTAPSGSSDSVAEPHFSLPDYYDKNNTLSQVASHIIYIGERIGYDHVGIGSDFDGMGKEHPRGLDGVDKFPDLVAKLLELGVSDDDAKKIVGGNLLRVWKDVDAVAIKMAKEGEAPGVDKELY